MTSLDLKQFRDDDGATSTFTEHRGEVTAIYSGGGVARGYLIGNRTDDEIAFRFVERDDDGALLTGAGTFSVEQTDEGAVLLRETWSVDGGDEGTKVLTEEVVPEQPAEVTLREITEHNIDAVLKLEVAPHQRSFVATVPISIAQAHHNDPPGWYRAVYAGDEPVGFVMLAYEDGPGVSHPGWYLWRFLIDQRHQRSGYGRRALEEVCHHVRRQQGPHVLWTSWVDSPGGPAPFYRAFGFEPTGELDEGEVVARLTRWPDGTPTG